MLKDTIGMHYRYSIYYILTEVLGDPKQTKTKLKQNNFKSIESKTMQSLKKFTKQWDFSS